jgi:exodeoxyribonuclease-3
LPTVAAWNVNSIKVRLPNLLAWTEAFQPDVLLLQEIKCLADAFPAFELKAAGYDSQAVGQKAYNGVAVLSRHPMTVRRVCLPGEGAEEPARYLEVETAGLVVASIYLPNGNPAPGDKFDYKLAWMQRLIDHARALLLEEKPLVLGGDFNVIPQARDCFDPSVWISDALFRPETRAKLQEFASLGLTDAYRALHPDRRAYTFWDYQAGAWQHDLGIRIDHLFLSPQAADRLVACSIDRGPRGQPKASDHTPIWCRLEG